MSWVLNLGRLLCGEEGAAFGSMSGSQGPAHCAHARQQMSAEDFRARSACLGICTLLVEKYSQFSLFTVGRFCRISANTELVTTEQNHHSEGPQG